MWFFLSGCTSSNPCTYNCFLFCRRVIFFTWKVAPGRPIVRFLSIFGGLFWGNTGAILVVAQATRTATAPRGWSATTTWCALPHFCCYPEKYKDCVILFPPISPFPKGANFGFGSSWDVCGGERMRQEWQSPNCLCGFRRSDREVSLLSIFFVILDIFFQSYAQLVFPFLRAKARCKLFGKDPTVGTSFFPVLPKPHFDTIFFWMQLVMRLPMTDPVRIWVFHRR